jgi:hypothetical protein
MRILLILFSIILSPCFSQIGMHQWKFHVNTSNAFSICSGDNKIFTAYENGLLEYDLKHNEKTLWSNTNFLSDVFISNIHFDDYSQSFWIGYNNGNIDQIKNETVNNLPAVKIANIMGDKKILKFLSYKNFIYAATSFGILKIDPIRLEVRDTYYPPTTETGISDFIIHKDSIYASTNLNIFKASISNPLLANPTNWILDKTIQGNSNLTIGQLISFKSKLLVLMQHNNVGKDSIYELSGNTKTVINNPVFNNIADIKALKVINETLCIFIYDGIYFTDSEFKLKESVFQYVPKLSTRPLDVTNYENSYWIADAQVGMVKWKDNYNNELISEPGPPKSSYFTMDCQNNKFAVAGGIIAKATFAFNTSGFYIYNDNNWNLYDRWNQQQWINQNIWDIGSIAINPKNINQIAVGSYSHIPLSIMNDGKSITNTYTTSNSPLENSSYGNGMSCVSDLKYDDKGNLWMLNSFTSNPLKVLTTDNTWVNFETGSSSKNTFAKKLILDYQGNKWMTIPGVGVIGINDQNTLSDLSDDVYKTVNDGLSTGAIPSKEVTAIAMDFNNNLWIGTDNGFSILYNAPSILDKTTTSYVSQRPKLKFEGNVEYLLGNTSISDIEVDGGNRKWIATANAGLFLINAEGSELISSFTKENSNLISNNILDIKINQLTGEMYLITDLGLVSFRIDASYEDPTYESATVFPNPYKPEHTSGITIQGIKYNSDIKITDAGGNVIYKSTSNGGTAYWNGRTVEGNRVSPGVYFIWTAPNEGEGKKIGKLVIL